MEFNSRAPALEMNGKETETVGQKKMSFQLLLEIPQRQSVG